MIHTQKGATTIQVLLAVIAVLLFLNLVHALSHPAYAEDDYYGRYAIGAFGVQDEDGDPYSGYYVVDTHSGSVSHYSRSE